MIGLDIGYRTIKVAAVKKQGKKFNLTAFSEGEIPPSSLQKNGIKDKNKITLSLKTALSKAKPKPISEDLLSGTLPESLVFTKILAVPKLSEEELQKAVPFEAAETLPVSKEEVYLDWHILGPAAQAEKVEVLVIASPKTLVDDYLEVISQAGLKLLTLESKPISISRAIISPSDTVGMAIVDIGVTSSSISIYDSETVRLTGTVASGSETINKLFAQEGILKIEEVENFKRQKGFSQANLKEKEILTTALSPVVQEVQNSIKYYHNRLKAQGKIGKIKLCGGGAGLPGISEFFQKQTGIESEMGDPTVHLSGGKELIPKEEILKYTVAIGAALRD